MRGSAALRMAVAPGGVLAGPWVRDELWRRARAVPSLDLRFADDKSLRDSVSGQELVTFTRASAGTYVGSDGVLRTATTNEPRFDHNPITGESLGLLVEEQRTNLLLQSAASDLSPWQRIQATVTPNVSGVIAPDGTQTADFLAENTATSEHYDDQSVAVTAGTTYTYSRFYKGTGAGNRIVWHRVAGAANAGVTFNPDTLSGISEASFVEYYPNGWIRVSTVFTAASTGSAFLRAHVREGSISPGASSYTGYGTSGFYTWGAQLEVGAFPTSYIPTTTAAATRSADVASISGSNFSSWYRQDEGTVFAEAARPDASRPNTVVASITDGTAANRLEVRSSSASSANARCEIVALGLTQYSNAALASDTAYKKIALAYAANDVNSAANGNLGITDTVATIPLVSQLYIGNDTFLTDYRPGHIRRLTYWPQRLGNEVLQRVTQ